MCAKEICDVSKFSNIYASQDSVILVSYHGPKTREKDEAEGKKISYDHAETFIYKSSKAAPEDHLHLSERLDASTARVRRAALMRVAVAAASVGGTAVVRVSVAAAGVSGAPVV